MASAIVHSLCCHCGKTFEHYQCKQRKYCSDECYALDKRKRIIRTCATCGKSYETTSKRSLKYCSRECAWQAQIGRERPDLKGRPAWSIGLTKATDDRLARVALALAAECPERDTLYDLYTEQNLTLKEIGNRFGVTPSTVSRWVSAYTLVRKRDTLTSEIISSCLESGLTRVQIGKLYNCSPEFVSIVAKRAGIRRVTAGVDWQPDANELRTLYWDQHLNHAEIGRMYGVTPSAIGKWFQRFEIPLRDNNTYGQSYTATDGHRVRSRLEFLVDEWLYGHNVEHKYEPYIGAGRFWADFQVGDTYIEIWGMMDNPAYRQQHDKKLGAYKQLGLKLLSIYPHDFPNLDVLSTLLPK